MGVLSLIILWVIIECRSLLIGLARFAKIGSGLEWTFTSFFYTDREFKGACLELPLIWHEEVSCGASPTPVQT